MLSELVLLGFTNVVAFVIILVLLMSRTVLLPLRVTLVLTILNLVIWQDIVYISNHSAENVLLLSNLTFIWPTIACLSFFLFIYQLGARKDWRKRINRILGRGLVFLVCIGTALQLVAQTTSEMFSSGTTPATLTRGDGYILYVVGLVVTLCAIVGFLILEVITARKRSQQYKALLTVLWTVSAASVYGISTNVVIPLISDSQAYASFGIVTVVIIALGFSLSILRNRLIDIRIYVVRTVTYLLSIATLAIAYSIATFFLSKWLLGYDTPLLLNIVNVAFIATVAFIFQPVKHFFDRITNRFFYSDNYDTDEFYAQLNRELSATNDMELLLRSAADLIAKTLKSEQVFFFVIYHDGNSVLTGTSDYTKPSPKSIDALNEYFEVNIGQKILIVDTLSREVSVRKLLDEFKVAIVLPLRSGEELIGYLYIGDQRKGRYTHRDMNVLQTISDELFIAIQNARSVQEIKEFNATLQQRIEEATKELRRTNTQLQRLDEAKDEFVSMASHQLRTPLTSVKGYISMVLEGDAGKITTSQRQLLGEAFTSSERMVHLIGDFLNVSRLQTGKFMLDQRPVDLTKVVAQEVDSLQTTVDAHNLNLIYRPPSHFPLLRLDEGKIRQVLMNFIDNAIYYSQEGMTITVKLGVEGSDAVLRVHDSGIGVPKAEQAHLFTKFFRATNARKQRPDGTGVGLFLAKKVITAHGGTMVFESEEGKGSTFGFRLPIKKLSDDHADKLDK